MSFFFPDKIIEIMCLFFCVFVFLLGYAEGKILAVNRQIKKLYLFNTSPSKENKEEKKPKNKTKYEENNQNQTEKIRR